MIGGLSNPNHFYNAIPSSCWNYHLVNWKITKSSGHFQQLCQMMLYHKWLQASQMGWWEKTALSVALKNHRKPRCIQVFFRRLLAQNAVWLFNIEMENGPFVDDWWWITELKVVIFHNYVNLTEGNSSTHPSLSSTTNPGTWNKIWVLQAWKTLDGSAWFTLFLESMSSVIENPISSH